MFAALCCSVSGRADAHGFAGKRFFPATLATDDPFVADELSLPTIQWQNFPASGEEPGGSETDFSVDVAKRITENFGIEIGATYKHIRPDGGDTQNGFDNLGLGLKYKFYQNDPHEAIVSAGVDWDIGGSGSNGSAPNRSARSPPPSSSARAWATCRRT